MRVLTGGIAVVLAFGACSPGPQEEAPTPSPTPAITQQDISSAVLDATDMGEEWALEPEAEHNTVQIGGEVGAVNVSALAEARSSFSEVAGTAFVSNSVFLMAGPEQAREVIEAHAQAAVQASWSQERTDEATTFFEISGTVPQLDDLGDQRFTAAIDAAITDGGEETVRRVQYVVYRVGSVLGFIVAQNTPAGSFARRQIAKVERIVP